MRSIWCKGVRNWYKKFLPQIHKEISRPAHSVVSLLKIGTFRGLAGSTRGLAITVQANITQVKIKRRL